MTDGARFRVKRNTVTSRYGVHAPSPTRPNADAWVYADEVGVVSGDWIEFPRGRRLPKGSPDVIPAPKWL